MKCNFLEELWKVIPTELFRQNLSPIVWDEAVEELF